MAIASAASRPTPPVPIRLMPLGDSITDGGTKHRSYRYHLHRLLARGEHHVQWVGSMQGVFDLLKGRNATRGRPLRGEDDWPLEAQQHEGHWGWTAKQVLHGHERQPQRGSLPGWLREDARQRRLPHVALVHLGTNDLTKHVVKEGQSVASVARQLRAVVQRLCRASPQVLTVLASPIPYCRFKAANAVEQRARRQLLELELAGRLRAISRASGSRSSAKRIHACQPGRVLYVNMSAAVHCEHLTSVDGVHPSAFAALRMAREWHHAIRPHLAALAARAATTSSSEHARPAAEPPPSPPPLSRRQTGRNKNAKAARASHERRPKRGVHET